MWVCAHEYCMHWCWNRAGVLCKSSPCCYTGACFQAPQLHFFKGNQQIHSSLELKVHCMKIKGYQRNAHFYAGASVHQSPGLVTYITTDPLRSVSNPFSSIAIQSFPHLKEDSPTLSVKAGKSMARQTKQPHGMGRDHAKQPTCSLGPCTESCSWCTLGVSIAPHALYSAASETALTSG